MSDLDQHLTAIQGGDTSAFERWVAAAEATVRLSLRSFAAVVDTEAVLQETLLRIWQVAPRFVPDGRPDGLLRLAIRIARNLAISERRRVRPGAFDPATEALPDDTTAVPPDPLLRQLIALCRAQLEGRPAQALEARLAAGGTEPDEVLAQRLAMRLNTFLQNFTRARRQLAECLKRRGVDLARELG
jgi:DNA-directed RNA polymerase specialized sigma24 family protein